MGTILLLSMGLFSCTETASLEALGEEDHYRNTTDAHSAVVGLYGMVMELAEQVVVLNELHADLMDVTPNADEELQEISNFTGDTRNAWVNPSKFYEVIQNCNDMLDNFDKMLLSARLLEDEYNELYSDVMTIRCWTYLRLGTLFGKIPYITSPLDNVASIKDISESSYLNLDALIPELLVCMESLPTIEQYSAGHAMNTTLDGYNLTYYSINKRCLLTELYLWNDEYEKAAKSFRDFVRIYESEAGDARYKTFCYVYQGSFVGAFMVTYARYKDYDYNSMVSLWKKIFELGINERYANWEHITCMTYDASFTPRYPFIRLFGTEGLGEYLLMPSQNAVDNYWNSQRQNNGFAFDGRGSGSSYIEDEQGRLVIQKYLNDYDPLVPYAQSGRWFVYRAGWLNLMYAEACNRVAETDACYQGDTLKPIKDYRKLAYGILNNGIGAQFSWRKENGDAYPNDSVNVSGWYPGLDGNFPAPYDFDCRYNQVPYHRGPWRDNGGIRQRASLTPVAWNDSLGISEVDFLENALLREMALETAFEGHRWTDVLRIARRQNRETPGKGTQLLQELMDKKFEAAGRGAAPVFLDDESNWYLPVNFK